MSRRNSSLRNLILQQLAVAAPDPTHFSAGCRRLRLIVNRIILNLSSPLTAYGFSNREQAFNYIMRQVTGLLRSKRELIRYLQRLHHSPNSMIPVDRRQRSRGHTVLIERIRRHPNSSAAEIVQDLIDEGNVFVSVDEERIVVNEHAITFVRRVLRDHRRN